MKLSSAHWPGQNMQKNNKNKSIDDDIVVVIGELLAHDIRIIAKKKRKTQKINTVQFRYISFDNASNKEKGGINFGVLVFNYLLLFWITKCGYHAFSMQTVNGFQSSIQHMCLHHSYGKKKEERKMFNQPKNELHKLLQICNSAFRG